MKLIQTNFLNDQKGFNFGQPATLIELEEPNDAESLLKNIIDTRYYDSKYFQEHSGYHAGQIVPNFWFVAEMARALKPNRVFEVGCGRGDVLHLLRRFGIEVAGVDFSADACAEAWADIKDSLHHGDLSTVCRERAQHSERFDLLLGFDIWEHLLPSQLGESLSAALSLLTDDGFCLFIVPAFGPDAVFGERFPLEFAENRPAFEAAQPFRYLLAEKTDPPIPASGHLIWAHTQWWEERFTEHGLVRMPALERQFHQYFDAFLPSSNRSFYLFRKDTAAAQTREKKIQGSYSWAQLARCLSTFAYATTVSKKVRGGLLRHLVASRSPERAKQLFRTVRSYARRIKTLK